MKYSFWKRQITLACAIALLFSAIPVSAAQRTLVAQMRESRFDPNFIISDTDFFDTTTLNVEQIYSFLKKKGNLHERVFDTIFGPRNAAEIIHNAAITYQINPQVLIVLLQKEQSLIEDTSPSEDQLNWATGFAICDDCSKTDPRLQQYRGFVLQVEHAAKRLRYYITNYYEFSFDTGETYNVDDVMVTMSNDATRLLYTYTPHLRGNFNFWKLFHKYFARHYPDGSLVKSATDQKIWKIESGKRRPFRSLGVFLTQFNAKSLVNVTETELSKYDVGTEINHPDGSFLRSPAGTVYLIQNGERRGFASREALRLLGINPEEAENVEWDELGDINEGSPITIASSYPAGALLQDNTTGGVYYVQDGIKQPIITKQIMTIAYPGFVISPVTPEELSSYETGNPALFPDGTIITSDSSPSVYVISNMKRRAVLSGEAFIDLGYSWDNMIETTDEAIDLHLLGSPIDSTGLNLSTEN